MLRRKRCLGIALAVTMATAGCGIIVPAPSGQPDRGPTPSAWRPPGEEDIPVPAPVTYEIAYTAGPITIDGTFDEPAWKSAERVDDFCWIKRPVDVQDWPPAGSRTAFRMLWDDTNLYLAAEMADQDVFATYKEHDERLWQEDVLEIFVKPAVQRGTDNHVYYELQVNPLGTALDLMFPRRGARTYDWAKRWQSGMKVKAVVHGTLGDWTDTDRGWDVEIALPLASFKDAAPMPTPGTVWKLNLSRYDYSVRRPYAELSSWSRLGAPSFHRHQDFNLVKFVKEPAGTT